jgi:hypothetical protein
MSRDDDTFIAMNSSPTSPDRLSMLAAAFTEALLSGDPRAAELVVRDAIDAGLPQGVIDEAVIAPAMREVGDLWLTVVDGVTAVVDVVDALLHRPSLN